MPEFFGRANLPDGMAAQLVEMISKRHDTAAQGFGQVGKSIIGNAEQQAKSDRELILMKLKADMQAKAAKTQQDAINARFGEQQAGLDRRADQGNYAGLLKSGQLQAVQPPAPAFPGVQPGQLPGFYGRAELAPSSLPQTAGNMSLPQTAQAFPSAPGPNMAILPQAPAKPMTAGQQAAETRYADTKRTKEQTALDKATKAQEKASEANNKAEISQAFKAHGTVSRQLAALEKRFKTQGTENPEYMAQAAPLMKNLRDAEGKLRDLKVPGFDESAPPGYVEDMAAALHHLEAKSAGFTPEKVLDYMSKKYPDHAPYVKNILGIKDPSTWAWIKGKAAEMLSAREANAAE